MQPTITSTGSECCHAFESVGKIRHHDVCGSADTQWKSMVKIPRKKRTKAPQKRFICSQQLLFPSACARMRPLKLFIVPKNATPPMKRTIRCTGTPENDV